MIVQNRTPYPDAEVERIVRRGMGGPGRQPDRVIVAYRTLKTDTRQGFTPYDHRLPTWLWVEPPYRYPQPGARSWRDELLQSAAHEVSHFRRPQWVCGEGCEREAESYAQRRKRYLATRANTGRKSKPVRHFAVSRGTVRSAPWR